MGHGGMGSVWEATHLGLEQKVAVKIVSPQYAKVPDIRRRFDVEAKAAARLRSRHVVQVFDNGELDDGTPYMVMEYLEGESLGRRLQRSGPLPLPECVRMMTHVAHALAKAHERGIVHRDIKPENIFLAPASATPASARTASRPRPARPRARPPAATRTCRPVRRQERRARGTTSRSASRTASKRPLRAATWVSTARTGPASLPVARRPTRRAAPSRAVAR